MSATTSQERELVKLVAHLRNENQCLRTERNRLEQKISALHAESDELHYEIWRLEINLVDAKARLLTHNSFVDLPA